MHAKRQAHAISKRIHFKAMSSLITVERVETKQTLIEVAAKTPEEAFDEVKAGQGHELGTVKNSELLIRDQDKPKQPHK
jgi:hypothetical protein